MSKPAMAEDAVAVQVRHWKRPDKIALNDRDPGKAYRFTRKEDVQRRLDEGMEIERKAGLKVSEAASMDGAIHYRGLILMSWPKNMAEERNEFYLQKHRRRIRASAVGASMTSQAQAINASHGGDLTGSIGKVIMKEGAVKDDGTMTSNTHVFDPRDIDPQDLQELINQKKKQYEESARLSQSQGDSK